MQPTEPTKYTNVSQEQYDRFKLFAKSKGMNISGNKDDVEFDKIPVHVEYTPEEKTLDFIVHEPHWLAPGVTAGALHGIVAKAMDGEVSPENENPQVTHDHRRQQAQTTVHDKEDEPAHKSTTHGHPAHHASSHSK